MDKQQIIQIRNILKAGKNLPVRIIYANSDVCIDESARAQVTLWDDENGYLFAYKLPSLQSDLTPSNIQGAVSLIAISYELIEAIETPIIPLSDLETSINAIHEIRPIGDDTKNHIITMYTELLHPDRFRLGPTDMNTILGPGAVNDKDDYYAGKFTKAKRP